MKPDSPSTASTPSASEPRLQSAWRKALFGTLFATVVLVLGLLLLEGVLRLGGYGHDSSFQRKVTTADGRHWWRENPQVTTPYFAPALRRRPQVFRLPVEKAPRTYRVFVLGSSAAMGDPEPAFSLSRTLEVLLRSAYPDVHFEVVNAGITAVNSHVVRQVAWQTLAPAQRTKLRPAAPAGLNKLPPCRGRRLHDRRTALLEPHLEKFSVRRGLLIDQLDPGANH